MRKKPTSRLRSHGDLFRRRIVISIPPLGAVVLAVAIIAGLTIPASAGKVMTAMGIGLSIVAIAAIVEARFQLRTFRYELQEKFGEALEALVIPDGEQDLRDSVDAIFEGGNDNAAHRVIRLRKRPHAS